MSQAVLLDLDRTLVDVESHVDYAAAVRDLATAGLLEVAPDATTDTSWGGGDAAGHGCAGGAGR